MVTKNNAILIVCAIIAVAYIGYMAFSFVSYTNTLAATPTPAPVKMTAAEAAAMVENAKPAVHVESFDYTNDKYGRVTVSGKIHNNGNRNVAVFGYVDFYDTNNVKIDSAIFSCKPDAHGMATFHTSTSDVDGKFTYNVRITNVYNN